MARKKKIETTDVTPAERWVYVPTQEAKERPRFLLKKGIAIGGPLTVKGRAIPEATPAQYRALYEQGYANLIEKKKA